MEWIASSVSGRDKTPAGCGASTNPQVFSSLYTLVAMSVLKASKKAKVDIFDVIENGVLSDLDAFLYKAKKSALATPNELGRYPIHVAALSGKVEMMERLVKAGADYNQIEDRVSQWTVVHYAVHSRNREMVAYCANLPDLKGE